MIELFGVLGMGGVVAAVVTFGLQTLQRRRDNERDDRVDASDWYDRWQAALQKIISLEERLRVQAEQHHTDIAARDAEWQAKCDALTRALADLQARMDRLEQR